MPLAHGLQPNYAVMSLAGDTLTLPAQRHQVRLVDARTLEVLRESVARQSTIFTRPSADATGMHAFAAMSVPEKTGQISKMLRRAVEEALPPLLHP